jgi:hypothetical protein
MKKLFEALFIFVFSFAFSGSLFSNSINKHPENGISVSDTVNIIANLSDTDKRIRISLKTGAGSSAFDDNSARDEDYHNVTINPGNIKSAVSYTPASIALEEKSESYKVFPNPATEKLFIQFNGWEGIKEIKLRDITGRSVFQLKSINEINEIDISSFPKGIYLIDVKNEKYHVVKKIKIQ